MGSILRVGCSRATLLLFWLSAVTAQADSSDEAKLMSLVVTGQGTSKLRLHAPDLLEAVAQALGGQAGEAFRQVAGKEVPEVEGELRATLEALPRNSHGNLNAAATRYALHRLFVRQHGWRVVGLDPVGETWNRTSPSEVVVLQRMPLAVSSLLESRLATTGLRPHEVAVLATLIEHLIHAEAVDRLRAAYRILGVSTERPANDSQALAAVDMYMASYIMAKDLTSTPREEVVKLYDGINEVYPSWPETQGFVREVASSERVRATPAPAVWTEHPHYDAPAIADVEVMSAVDLKAVQARVEEKGYSGFSVWRGNAYLKASSRISSPSELHFMGDSSPHVFYLRAPAAQEITLASSATFSDMARTVERIGDRYGRWQDKECRTLKHQLMEMEDRGTGRVRLSDFYGKALDGKWQFQESVDYLRQLGALDESNPANLRVIIPNYIEGPSNCVGTSAYYSVCCLSECEELLGQLERDLASPEASPETIAGMVAAMPTATVPANRVVSDVQLHRLRAIAEEHGGTVPIYGRLFAQWMHHEYPRECPYPHLAGTTKPLNLDDWMQQGLSPSASDVEMKLHAERAHAARGDAPREAAPWVYHEELYGIKEHTTRPLGWEALHAVVAVTASAMVLLALSRTACLVARRSRAALGTATTTRYPKGEAPSLV